MKPGYQGELEANTAWQIFLTGFPFDTAARLHEPSGSCNATPASTRPETKRSWNGCGGGWGWMGWWCVNGQNRDWHQSDKCGGALKTGGHWPGPKSRAHASQIPSSIVSA